MSGCDRGVSITACAGKPSCDRIFGGQIGSIPACAGEPLSASWDATANRVDPRVCGEASFRQRSTIPPISKSVRPNEDRRRGVCAQADSPREKRYLSADLTCPRWSPSHNERSPRVSSGYPAGPDLAQARRARSPRIAQAPGALVRAPDCPGPSGAGCGSARLQHATSGHEAQAIIADLETTAIEPDKAIAISMWNARRLEAKPTQQHQADPGVSSSMP